MRIAVIGTGYVGLCTGVVFASKGHDVTAVDIDEEKVEQINQGNPPIYEEGLEDLLQDALDMNHFRATTDTAAAVGNADLTLICVGTPSKESGEIDLSAVKAAARDVGDALQNQEEYHVVTVKSTVVPETTETVVKPLLEEASGKTAGEDFGLCMSPEFLREGKAVSDVLNPDRIVIGGIDDRSRDRVAALYEDMDCPVLRMSPSAAEMVKYASNALLATKISFANEVGNLCKSLNIDVYDVMDAVGADHRLNRDFLNAGAGFGGSCFPKDVAALRAFAQENDVPSHVLDATLQVNEQQPGRTVELLEDRLGDLAQRRVAVLGLAFKPGTDDIRESPAHTVIRMLRERDAEIVAYDPEAVDNMRERYGFVEYVDDAAEALHGADAAILLTDWDEFKNLGEETVGGMNTDTLIEGRRVLADELDQVEGVCW